MDRWVHASRTVRGPVLEIERTLESELASILRSDRSDQTTEAYRPDGSFTIELSTHVGGFNLRQPAWCSIGVAYRRLGSLRVPLRWWAQTAQRAFPVFNGYLEFEHLAQSVGQLTLVGTYRPPFGPVGAAADAMGLSEVANATVTALLENVVAGIERVRLTGSTPPTAITPPATVLLVRDLMTPEPITFDPDMSLRTAAELLLHFHISGAPVVTDHGELVGVVSESDLMQKETIGQRQHRCAVTVGQICTKPALTTHPDVSVHEAAQELFAHGISRLVVVEHARIVGILTRHDVLRGLTRTDAQLQRLLSDVVADIPIEARVEWGVAIVRGEVASKAAADALASQINLIDGILGLDTHGLTWDTRESMPTRS